MKTKIESVSKPNKYIYYDHVKGADTLLVFMTGFSGGKNFPLFSNAKTFFRSKKYGTLLLNFCNDYDDLKIEKDALNTEDVSVSMMVKELDHLLLQIEKSYRKIVLIGHSFGAIIVLKLMVNNKSYSNKLIPILWDPSLLPWPMKDMNNMFVLSKKTGKFNVQGATFSINKRLYRDLMTIDSLKLTGKLSKPICVVVAKNSADVDGQKYIKASQKPGQCELHTIARTNHFFDGAKAQSPLFSFTRKYIEAII